MKEITNTRDNKENKQEKIEHGKRMKTVGQGMYWRSERKAKGKIKR